MAFAIDLSFPKYFLRLYYRDIFLRVIYAFVREVIWKSVKFIL